MTHNEAVSLLLASITAERPQSRQRERLLQSLLQNVVTLAEQDPDTLDLKIAETALSELVEAFEVFAPYRAIPKVTIFGSARTPETHVLYQLAHDFAKAIAHEGWMVITGAGPGIMAAGIEGAGRDRSFGVNIRLPFEQGANEFIASDVKLVEMRYFFTRKVMLTKESKAFVAFPGGFGTLDEVFELFTLLQTGKATPAPVILFDSPNGEFWNDWQRFIKSRVMVDGWISPLDDRFFRVCTSVDEAKEEIANFYRNYHSIRTVGSLTVLRMLHEPNAEQLAVLRSRFSDVLLDGRFEVSEPLADEVATNDYLELARLVFHFDRRSYGELRQMIDMVNSWQF